MKDLLKKMQKVLNALKVLFALTLIISCSSVKRVTIKKEILNSIIENSKGNIYYRTIKKEGNILVSSYLNSEILEFYLCGTEINTPIKISKKDNHLLKEGFENLKRVRIDKIFPKFSNKIIKNNVKQNTTFITLPVLLENNKMAIYYSKNRYGGSFILLKKIEDKWEQICSNSVWIE